MMMMMGAPSWNPGEETFLGYYFKNIFYREGCIWIKLAATAAVADAFELIRVLLFFVVVF